MVKIYKVTHVDEERLIKHQNKHSILDDQQRTEVMQAIGDEKFGSPRVIYHRLLGIPEGKMCNTNYAKKLRDLGVKYSEI